jgi:hypothetical protein
LAIVRNRDVSNCYANLGFRNPNKSFAPSSRSFWTPNFCCRHSPLK